jgi:hypothetical protein
MWIDAAHGEHSDLLGLIRLMPTLREAMTQARSFLDIPMHDPLPRKQMQQRDRRWHNACAIAAARPRHAGWKLSANALDPVRYDFNDDLVADGLQLLSHGRRCMLLMPERCPHCL